MTKKTNPAQMIVGILFFVLAILFIVFHIDSSDLTYYRFPKLLLHAPFWIFLCVLLVLPLVGAFVGFLISRKSSIGVSVALLIGYVLILGLLTLALSIIDLMWPIICSCTTNEDMVGQYDSDFSRETALGREAVGYPVAAPTGASDTKHFYWYIRLSSNGYGIMDSWHFSEEDDFRAELDRLRQYGWEITEYQQEYEQAPGHSLDVAKLFIDWDQQNIVYFYVCGYDTWMIPNSLEDFYQTEYSDALLWKGQGDG